MTEYHQIIDKNFRYSFKKGGIIKIRKISIMVLLSIILISSIAYTSPRIGERINDVLFTDIVTEINGEEIELFNINGSTAIYVSELEKIPSISVEWDSEQRKVLVSSEVIKDNEEAKEDEINNEDLENGFSKSNSVELGEVKKIIENDAENKYNLSITRVIRGPEAYNLIKSENQFNDDLADGYEYILAKVKISVVELTTNYIEVEGFWDFDAVSSDGITYDNVSVTFDNTSNYEEFDRKLYEGAVFEGWTSFVVRKNDERSKALYKESVWFNLFQ